VAESLIPCATPHIPLGGSMTHAKLMQWSAVLFLTLAWANSSLADNCNGNWSNVTISAETLEVATGHTVTYFVSRGSTTSANSLFNGVGECGGYALATPDGKVRVAGICTRKMNDGASESDVFAMEPGAERGTWKQVAGTGALADKHYSGWWKSVISDGKAEMGIWGGNCN
jgi:hypothetical protein